VGVVAERSRDPYQILISCLLSLRTKDPVTEQASRKLFRLAKTPNQMVRLPEAGIRKAIYPVGFYKTKARTVRRISREMLTRFGGKVPDTLEELLSLKGVGRKTANLVITLAFQKQGICVDTHVHRISNRFGLVQTKTPEKTEEALRQRLPAPYWREWNDLLVTFGQNLCKPISPHCSRCPITRYCPRIGVTHHR